MSSQPTRTASRDIDLRESGHIGVHLLRLLRERIVRGELPPGSRISEAEIARAYGVSRQPAREAFMKLADEKLLVVRPQRATLVRQISIEQVKDARFVREAIEADITRLLARRADGAMIEQLRAALREQKRAARREPQQFMVLDEAFHRQLADLAGKSRAWQIIESIKSHMDRVRYLSLKQYPAATLVEQHEAIVEAIAAGKPGAAERAMRRHLREILSALPEIAKRYPDYFDAESTDPPLT